MRIIFFTNETALEKLISQGGDVRVCRNEDAHVHLKRDSADLQAPAVAPSRGEPPKTVGIRRHGGRVPPLSPPPNAIPAREAGSGHRPFPLIRVTPAPSLRPSGPAGDAASDRMNTNRPAGPIGGRGADA